MNRTLLKILSLLIVLTSCLNDEKFPESVPNANKLVIEALVTNESGKQVVKVSRTVSVEDSVTFKAVENAVVHLMDDNFQFEELKQVSPGVYETDSIKGIPGRSYTLEVTVNDTLYSATEKMYKSGSFDSITVKYIEDHSFFEDGYYIHAFAFKESNTVEYYKASVTENDSLYNGYEDMILFDNIFVQAEIELIVPYAFEAGDTVKIKSYTLSKEVFDYHSALFNLTVNVYGNISRVIENPPSNISNGALGYFQVSDVKELVQVIE